ncbi:hypothetical protein G6F29_014318 [Rhizopus arrhizus]|nr:hypothetical protein G6F29_014318 [Rhizopus arrhizus]
MSRRVATPINVPSNAPKRARISSNIAGSSSTVVPSSSSLFSAPVPASASVPFSVPVAAPVATFGGHTGAEAIGAASTTAAAAAATSSSTATARAAVCFCG